MRLADELVPLYAHTIVSLQLRLLQGELNVEEVVRQRSLKASEDEPLSS